MLFLEELNKNSKSWLTMDGIPGEGQWFSATWIT